MYLAIFLFLWSALAQSITPVPKVDLERYKGTWYEIARYPNKHQAECKNGTSVAEYSLDEKKNFTVLNRCTLLTGSEKVVKGISRIVDAESNAKLQVNFAPSFIRFFGLGWGDYWVIKLDSEYQYAVVSEPKKEYLWVISRTKVMAPETFEEIKKFLVQEGFNIEKLIVAQ